MAELGARAAYAFEGMNLQKSRPFLQREVRNPEEFVQVSAGSM